MKNVLMIIITILCIFQSSFAKANQPTLELGRSLNSIDVTPYLWYLEDASHALQAEQLSKGDAAFAVLDRKSANFGFSTSTWWARAKIRNIEQGELAVILSEAYVNADTVEFTLLDPQGNILAQSLSGDTIKPAVGVERYRLPFAKFQLPAGDSLLLIKIRTEGSVIFNIAAHSPIAFYEAKTSDYVFFYTMVGILLVMAAYNVFTWLQLRKIAFMVYVGFITCITLQATAYTGIITHHLEDPTLFFNQGYLLFGNATSFFVAFFAILFLSLKERHPWLYRLNVVAMILAVLMSAIVFFSYNSAAKISLLISLAVSFLALASGVVSSLKGYRPAYFYTLAWTVVIMANFVRMSMLSGNIPQTFLTEWGVLIGTVLEVVLLSLALADQVRIAEKQAFLQIERLNTDLAKERDVVVSLNQNLEKIVEERTREIKSILKNIKIGIVMVRDQSLAITENYSAYMHELYQAKEIQGHELLDVVLRGSDASNELVSQVHTILQNSIGEPVYTFEANGHILPRELTYNDQGQGKRFLQLDWNPVIDQDGNIEKLLVSIKDVTDLKALEAANQEKSKAMGIIAEILEVQPRPFGVFIEAVQRFLAENERLIKANTTANPEILKILMINMHTAKGAARALGLKTLTPLIHEAEQYYSQVMNKQIPWVRTSLLEKHLTVSDLVNTYQELNQQKLGRSSTNIITLSVDFAERLRQVLARCETEVAPITRSEVIPFREYIENHSFLRAEVVFREVLSNAEMLARDLKKESPNVTINDSGIKLSSQGQELVRNAFVHIIRNTMDHGIETAEERKAKGKSPQGNIQVNLQQNNQGSLEIVYQDDGRGLNLRAIRRIALEKGLITDNSQLTLDELAQLIFASGFSTSASITDISGRGVGMSAVQQYIQNLKGELELVLHKDDKVVNPEFIPFHMRIVLGQEVYIRAAA